MQIAYWLNKNEHSNNYLIWSRQAHEDLGKLKKNNKNNFSMMLFNVLHENYIYN